jgi:hypothetical protein
MSDIALENIERISSGWTKASVDMGPPKDGISLNLWNGLAGQEHSNSSSGWQDMVAFWLWQTTIWHEFIPSENEYADYWNDKWTCPQRSL